VAASLNKQPIYIYSKTNYKVHEIIKKGTRISKMRREYRNQYHLSGKLSGSQRTGGQDGELSTHVGGP